MSKKILIIRFSAMGDVIFTTPTVRILKQQSKAEVHFLVKKKFAGLLSANPYIDKIHKFEKAGLSPLMKHLKSEQFDIVVDLQSSIRSKWISFNLSKACLRVDKLNIAKFRKIYFGHDRLPDLHVADRNIQTVKSLNVVDDGLGMDFFLPENIGANLVLPTQFIALVIGATHFTKRIPTEKLIQLIRSTEEHVVLIGGKDVSAVAEEIKKEIKEGRVLNMVGKCSLQESAYIIKQSSVVVAPDTGMMHIAAALEKKVVSVWGSTIPEFGVFPYYGNKNIDHAIIEQKDLRCRPCSKHGKSTCPKGHFKCMNDLDPNQIVERINKLI